MAQSLYYDKNDGLLCWKNDNGEYIPVKTNLALMPKNLKIENRVLKIFDYDADAWKSVPSATLAIEQGDFQLATVADLQLKQDKALQYPEFDSLLTAELDPGIYNILVRDLEVVGPPVDPTDPPIMEMSEEGNLLDTTAIPSLFNNSAILLVSAKYPRVLISGKGIFTENDGVWKEQAGFTENYKSELQEQFESLKTTVEQTEVSTVTCDDVGNLTIRTSKIDQADGVTTTTIIKGKDGVTPQLRIKDGYWQISYDCTSWTTLGKATGDNGQDGKDGADGEDGKDGADGQDGKDGITPQLKIEDSYWYISYDNGVTWTESGKATGEDGKDGENGDSFFTSDQAETIKTLLDAYDQDLANKVSVHDYDKTVESLTNQIAQLTEKLAAAETLLSQLNSIDLSGLAVAYPKESYD